MYRSILVPVLFDEGHDTQASYLAALALADEETKFILRRDGLTWKLTEILLPL